MARDTFAVGTRVKIIGPSIFNDDTRRGEVTEVEDLAYPTHLGPRVLVKKRDGSIGRLYSASSLEVVSQFKVGDAVRVKAGSPKWLTVGGRMEPRERFFGEKLTIEKKAAPTAKGDECYHVAVNGTHNDGIGSQFLEPWNDAEEWRDGAWVARKPQPAVPYRVGDRVRVTGLSQIGYDHRGKTGRVTTVGVTAGRDYVNVDIDGEPSAANRTYYLDAIEPATPKQFAEGVAVRLLPGFESVLCSGYDANALRGKKLITIHKSLSYGGIALSETGHEPRLATLKNSEFLEAWVDPPAPTPSHIVMLREDGRLKPNSPPVEHSSQGDAEREAERLAAKAPGSAFEVWGRVATRRVEPEPKYRVGEQVRVVRDTLGHGFRIGDVVTVVLVESDGGIKASGWVPGRGILSQWVSDSTMGSSVEPLDAPKLATASQPAPQFAKGDKVRAICDTKSHGGTPIPRDAVVNVEDPVDPSGHMGVKYRDSYLAVRPENFVTASQVFRNGDTIRVIRDTRCHAFGTPIARGTIFRVDDRAPMTGVLINARRETDNVLMSLRKADTEVV